MSNLPLIGRRALDGLAVAGLVGFTASAFVDTGSSIVIGVVVALGFLTIGLLEWSHGRARDTASRAGRPAPRSEQGTHRALDELRAARIHEAGPAHRHPGGYRPTGSPTAGSGHSAVSHALRSV
jgi:hypothetical protein